MTTSTNVHTFSFWILDDLNCFRISSNLSTVISPLYRASKNWCVSSLGNCGCCCCGCCKSVSIPNDNESTNDINHITDITFNCGIHHISQVLGMIQQISSASINYAVTQTMHILWNWPCFGVSLLMPNPMGRFCWPTGWRIESVAGFCRPRGGADVIMLAGALSWPGAMNERLPSEGPGNNCS